MEVLILKRNVDERVIVEIGGQRVDVMVTAVGHGVVSLGFAAPKSVTIHREEVYREIHEKKQTGVPFEA
jgi:carbon storage regulator